MSLCSTCRDSGMVPVSGRGEDGYDRCPDCGEEIADEVFVMERNFEKEIDRWG